MTHDENAKDDGGLDDPRLTAHAMGEAFGPLTPEEQAEVEAIRATADALRAGFAATPMPVLDPAHRAAILQRLSGSEQGLSGPEQGLSHEPAKPGRGTVPGPVVRLSEYSGLGALAATLLMVVGLGIVGATGLGSRDGSGLYVKSFSAPDYVDVYREEGEMDWVLKDQNADGTWEVASVDGQFNYKSVDIPNDVTVRLTGTLPANLLSLRGKTIHGVVGNGGSGGGGGGVRVREAAGGKVKVNYGGRRDLIDDVANGLNDGASIGGLDNGGVGVPSNGSGKPSAGAFFIAGSGGDFRGRPETFHFVPRMADAKRSLEARKAEIRANLLELESQESGRSGTIADLRRQLSDVEAAKAASASDKASAVAALTAEREKLRREFESLLPVTGGADDENMALVVTPARLAATTQELLDKLDRGEFLVNEGEYIDKPTSTFSHPVFVENPWIRPYGESALSTFSIDVDTAGYSIVRRSLMEQNQLPAPGALRVEELVNYFPYAYEGPITADPFAVHVDAAACPWAPGHRLVRIALKGREVEEAVRPAANLVFLLDVSGSMNQPNKLPLVKQSIELLTERLTARDRVAMVVYAGNSGLVLPSTAAGDHAAILAALGRLEAGGSTNGGAGIELAYKVAAENFVTGGINRVVLATDGDFNVGVSDPSALVKMVEERAKGGVFLTALGYGMDNLNDDTLEQLADKGNGNYGYIDTLGEARKVLVEQGMSTLHCIAKDVKIQVEFNPAKVAGYRLLGYENRMLAAQDFADDTKDAGEIGAGHTVTALYEVVPVGVEVPGAAVDELRYQRPGAFSGNAETLVVKLRWKEPEGAVSTPREFPFVDAGLSFDSASADFRFAAAVAAFGMVLRDSKCAGSANLDLVREIAAGALGADAGGAGGADAGGYRAEFITLVEKARTLRK